jgi:TolB protein
MPRIASLLSIALLAGALVACAAPSPTPAPTPLPATDTPAPTATYTPMPASTSTSAPLQLAETTQEWVYPLFVVYTQITQTGAEIFSLDFTQEPPGIYQLTETEGAAFRPRWSPDLRHLAYVYVPPGSPEAQLWLYDNMEGVARVAFDGGISGLDDFDWSPAGRYIAYAATQPDGVERDVYRLDTETGDVVNLTADSTVWDSAPAWSPDSRLIAFVSDRAARGKGFDNIWVMAPDGSEPRNLTNSSWEDVAPAWSPDGNWIAFYRWSVTLDAGAEGGPSGLWIMRADGSDQRLLVELDSFLAGLDAPAWSPDGRYIAYQLGVSADADIFVYPVEGGEPVNVSNMAGHDYDASWSPDSQSLLFTHEGVDMLYLYVGMPDGREPSVLLGSGGNGLAEWAPPVSAQQ